ncbi:SURF1 family protein [Kaarinaea lacus]
MVVIGKYEFRPRLVPTLATLLLLPILIKLGFWQLDRAEEKRIMLAEFNQALQMPAVNLNNLDNMQQLKPYQKVNVKGRYDTEHQFLLDNKVHNGKVGYQVLTPLRLEGRTQSILINRGWIPLGKNRNEVPQYTTPEQPVAVNGQVKFKLAETLQIVESSGSDDKWPAVVQWIDVEKFSAKLGYPLSPLVVLMDKQDSTGFVRDWFIKKVEPEKSTGYAVQWFSLALALVIIYLVTNTRNRNKVVEVTEVEK